MGSPRFDKSRFAGWRAGGTYGCKGSDETHSQTWACDFHAELFLGGCAVSRLHSGKGVFSGCSQQQRDVAVRHAGRAFCCLPSSNADPAKAMLHFKLFLAHSVAALWASVKQHSSVKTRKQFLARPTILQFVKPEFRRRELVDQTKYMLRCKFLVYSSPRQIVL